VSAIADKPAAAGFWFCGYRGVGLGSIQLPGKVRCGVSRKAAYFRAIESLARAGRGDVMARLVREGQAVVDAFQTGGVQHGREVMRDLEARSLLSQALPDWDWRE